MTTREMMRGLKGHAGKNLLGVPVAVWATLGLVALMLGLFLLKADKPWDGRTGERLAAGERMKMKDCIIVGLYVAAGANLALTVVGMAALPLIKRYSTLPQRPIEPLPRVSWTLPTTLGLAGILIFGLALRAPTFYDSIHRDEQDTLRRNTYGYHEQQPDGTLKFKERGWREVLFENGVANNPVFYSITSHLGHKLAWGLGLPRERFSKTAVRAPSLVGGMLGLAALWLLLMKLGMPEVAWVATLLGAMHPMHVDHSAEGRGYGFVLLFTLLQVLALTYAMREGRWRYWAAYGASQFLLLYSNPGSLYFPLTVNVILLGMLTWQAWMAKGAANAPLERQWHGAQLTRWVVANAVSAMVYLQLMAPSIPQMLHNFEVTNVRGPMDAVWIFQSMTQFTTGLFLILPGAENKGMDYLQMYLRDDFVPAHPIVTPWILALTPLLTGLGLYMLWRRGPIPRLLACLTVVPPTLCYLHHVRITGLYLYYWYLIFALPFLLITWAAGLTLPFKALFHRLANARDREGGSAVLLRNAWVAVPVIALPIFFGFTHQGRMELETGEGSPYVEIERGKYDWRVYPEGYMVRLLPKEDLLESANAAGPAADAEDGATAN